MIERPGNPFGSLIVQDPRQREPSVPGLNERPLMRLLEHFERLAEEEVPRPPVPAGQALLVTSADPGYGKSHLIGRLFHALHGRATAVYVQPFQNAATPFQSLLLAVGRELHFPDRSGPGGRPGEAPTQLDALAHAVLAHALADLAEGAVPRLEIETPAATVRLLREDPVAAFARGRDPWAAWLQGSWEQLEPFLEEALARRGVEPARPAAWLRVLRSYAFAPEASRRRRACLDWLTGQPLEAEEAEAIGLTRSDLPGEHSAAETNALCLQRLRELCTLSSFFRPFVFCFDQTEVYGHHPALARAFGLTVAALVHELPNQLTLITANQDPWTARLRPNLELADRQRIAEPALTLEGLCRSQAVELVRLRMKGSQIEPRRVEAFLRGPWLGELFPAETSQVAPRVFLQACRERWSKQPVRDYTVRELCAQREERLRLNPKRHLFEPDPLQWLVEVAARGLPGLTVELRDHAYLPVCWRLAERTVYFGFLAGSHWRQWQAVAQEVQALQEGDPLPVQCFFFRGAEQPPIPGEHWQVRAEIAALLPSPMALLVLEAEEMARLYTPRDLYAQAAQGDIAYTPEEIVEFLHSHLAPWWARLRGEPLPDSPTPVPVGAAGAPLQPF